ncbi:MXAN_6577-like cysteine-rich protein [Sorangium sp. So ce128]|uniref:MXAN_6577-like cysteine-rich protein n=1 Tax=Sorangium sp. So ce128 TaxID=3133281 RepID=UPI003F61429F
MNRHGFRFGRALSRAALWLPAALLSAASACGGDDNAPAPRCEAPYSVCGGACVALHADPEHCGACGQQCPAGEACLQGACEPLGTSGEGGGGGDGGGGGGGGDGGGPSECREGRYVKRCGDECVDTRTDPDHCGKCGAPCPPGRACSGSICRQTCLPGLTDCAGSCVDLAADPQHCGRCDRACDPGRPCEGGTCACSAEPSQDIGSAVPQRVSGTTIGAADGRWLTCSEPGAADQAFLFTAPHAGTYLFDTFEASYDTALGALRADTCEELACNDNAGSVQSQISVDLAEGERILVVVSGARGAQGDFTLRVAEPGPVQCAPTALDPVVPQTVTGTTVLREDTVSADCDISATPDATYTFTAPSDGTYVFSGRAPSDLIVEVREGGTCTGRSLYCRYGAGESNAFATLEAGQTVLVAVADPAGPRASFTLEIVEAPPCPGVQIGATLPQTVTGNNEHLRNLISACATFSTGGEATYGFTAPREGIYTFDATGSSFPVLMEARRASCAGDLIACVDGLFEPALITLSLAADETVILVVDTAGPTGDYRLEVDEVRCPLIDLGSTVPQTVTGTTADLADHLAPDCASRGAPEATYRFTAPADALYIFDTDGSALDTVLEVLDGSCSGPSLRCNDNVDPAGVVTHSRASLFLSAGQTVIVSVDSASTSGDYTLNITQREAPQCPLFALDAVVPQSVTGSTEGYPDLLAPSCASVPGGEATYSFTAPADGFYRMHTVGSTIDTILSVRDGGCEGDEMACVNDSRDSSKLVWLDAGQTALISVDSHGAEGDYMLHVDLFDGTGTCDKPIELAPLASQTATGTTKGSLAKVDASCGGIDAPEVAYLFTAPEAGTYTIDTVGSDYDTVLAVFDGDCYGEEIACSDDVLGEDLHLFTSEVTVSLDAGQSIVIVVDGAIDESGVYELNIHP